MISKTIRSVVILLGILAVSSRGDSLYLKRGVVIFGHLTYAAGTFTITTTFSDSSTPEEMTIGRENVKQVDFNDKYITSGKGEDWMKHLTHDPSKQGRDTVVVKTEFGNQESHDRVVGLTSSDLKTENATYPWTNVLHWFLEDQ